MIRLFLALVTAVMFSVQAWAIGPAKLSGVDIYGTDRVSSAEVNAKFYGKIKTYFQKKQSRYPKDQKEAARLYKQIEGGVRREWNFAWVRLSWLDQFTVDDHNVFLTFDVVENNDIKTRMPFNAPPKKTFSDPNSLLAAWSRYSELGWSLVRSGQLTTDRPECPSLYCLWGSQKPELKSYEDKFIQLVPISKEVLIQILNEDKDAVHRSNAVYLLSYLNDAVALPKLLTAAMKDPDMEVRGAALRIYADLAVYHKDIALPADQIALALDYPTVEDRNKALAVVTAMADEANYRAVLIRRGAPILLKLLKSIQPANHDLAYSILGILSKQNYGPRDYPVWQQWISKAQAEVDREEKKKK